MKYRKFVALLLCLVMISGVIPGNVYYAFAEDTGGSDQVSASSTVAMEKAVESTPEPTAKPTPEPTEKPTPEPTAIPTPKPAEKPTPEQTAVPTPEPTEKPTPEPTAVPTPEPTTNPTQEPTTEPTPEPTAMPTPEPSAVPTPEPTAMLTPEPTAVPTPEPTAMPTPEPTPAPTPEPLFSEGYALVLNSQTEVRQDPSSSSFIFTYLSKDDPVYVSHHIIVSEIDPGRDWLECRFDTGEGIRKGYIRAERLNPLTEAAELDALLRKIKNSGAIEEYQGNLLMQLDCVLLDEPSPELTPEPTSELALESTPEPSIELVVKPTPETFSEPDTEPTPVLPTEPLPEPVTEQPQETAPETTPELTSDSAPELTPELTIESTLEMTPEPTPEFTPELSLELTAELTPDPISEFKPEPNLEPTAELPLEPSSETAPAIITLDAFLPLESEGQLVLSADQTEAEVLFPAELIGLSGEVKHTIAVTWLRDDTMSRAWMPGNTYVYAPILPEGYLLAEGLALPTLTVRVKIPDSVTIAIDPMVAAPGDTVTLTATVTGYEGATFQWQWAELPEAENPLEPSMDSDSAEGQNVEAQTLTSFVPQDDMVWTDESDAVALEYVYIATISNLNRYWRLSIIPAADLQEPIYYSNAVQFLEGVTSITLDAFLPLDGEGLIVLPADNAEADILFPAELIGLSGENQHTIFVTWLRDDATSRAWMPGNMYVYAPVLPEGYLLAEGLALPALTVRVKLPDSVSISIEPMVATPGDTVTLTATVTGYEGASFQWQWAAMPKEKVDQALSRTENTDTAEKEKQVAEDLSVQGTEAEALKWQDEPGAIGLSFSFTATEENLNRYWRLMIMLQGLVAENGSASGWPPFLLVFAGVLLPSVSAEESAIVVTSGYPSILMTSLQYSIPVLNQPATDTIYESSQDITFSWVNTGATNYRLLIDSPLGTIINIYVTGISYLWRINLAGSQGLWKWKVASINSDGIEGTYSAERSFHVVDVSTSSGGDFFRIGDIYWAGSYAGHFNYFGASPDTYVADINTNHDAECPLYSPADGYVEIKTRNDGNDGKWGWSIYWYSLDRREIYHLAHLRDEPLCTGKVYGGQLIGYMGGTGLGISDYFDIHLHISRSYDGVVTPLVLSGRHIYPPVPEGVWTTYPASLGQKTAPPSGRVRFADNFDLSGKIVDQFPGRVSYAGTFCDIISRVEISDYNMIVDLFEDEDYGGRHLTLLGRGAYDLIEYWSSDWLDIDNWSINDNCSSYQITKISYLPPDINEYSFGIILDSGTPSFQQWLDDRDYSGKVWGAEPTPPTQYPLPILALPAHGTNYQFDQYITFSWSSTGAPQYNLLLTPPIGAAQLITRTTTSYTWPMTVAGNTGTWSWKVASVDSAGNVGDYSTAQTFTILEPIPDLPLQYLTFALNMDGLGYTVSKCSTEAIGIRIPESYNGLPVTSIGVKAFSACGRLVSVSIPPSVTTIGAQAFYESRAIRSVSIPPSVTSLSGTFYSYEYVNSAYRYITSVTLVGDWTGIPASLCANCDALPGIVIPSGVTVIGNAAFSGCDLLTSVTIPSTVTGISNNAFASCTSLEGISLPSSVVSLGDGAFASCSKLISIDMPGVQIIGNSAFSHCYALVDGSLTTSVTSIGDNAFSGCSELVDLILPSSVTSIGVKAFSACGRLVSVSIPPSVTTIRAQAFYESRAIRSVSIPPSVTSLSGTFYSYEYVNSAYRYITSVTLVGDWTSIPASLCANCSGLTNLAVPTGVTSIGSYAFQYCSGLASIIIPSSVLSIADSAFYGISNPFIIYGNLGSAAQIFADRLGYRFIELTVITPVTGISIDVTELAMPVFGQRQLLATLTPLNTTETVIYWSSSNGSIADVAQDGTVTAFGTGTVNITARAANGSQAYVTIQVVRASYDMSGAKWDYTVPFTYDGSEMTISVVGLPTGVTVASYSGNVGTNPGIYTASVTFTYSEENYNAPVIEPLDWIITPSAPAISAVEAISATSLKVTWDTVPLAESYVLERATSAAGTYSAIYTGPETTFTNTGLTTAKVYYYRVRSVCTVDEKPYTSPASAIKAGAPFAGTSVTRTETVSATSVKVTYSAAVGVTGYQVYRSDALDGTYTQVYSGTATAYTNTGLTTGTAYYYKVRTFKTIGTATYYSALSAAKAAIPLAKPSTPSAAAAGSTSITVTWSAITGAAGYQLYRSTSSTGTYTRVYSGTDPAYTNTGLSAGSVYYYKARAYAAIGGATLYGLFSAVKAGVPLASPSISSAAAAGSTSIKVSWGSASYASGYQLYRSTGADGAYSRVYSGTAKAYTNTGLTTGSAYYYKVRAYKVIGTATYYGPFGAVKIGVPLAAAKTPSVSAVDGTSVKASWSAVTGAAGYLLYRSTSSTGTYTRVYSGTDRTYTDTGLTSGRAYYYKVRAYAQVGDITLYGPYGSAKAGVPLAAPAISSAAAAGSTSIKVSWGSASTASGYQLYRSTSETGTYAKVYSGTARAYTNIGLTTGKAYYYKVRAYKVIGTAIYYGPFGAVRAGVPLAAAKTTSVSIADSTSVKVSWSAVTGATGYQLLRSTSATGSYASVYIGTERTFTDTALTAGTTYYYKVRAYKPVGTETCYSPYSAYKAIKPI